MADDYCGYNGIVNDNDLTRIQCWSHASRKFVDLEELYPEKIGNMLNMRGLLCRRTREFRFDGVQTGKRRRALCGPVIKEIDNWRKGQAVLPRSAFGKALHYLHHCWEGFTGFRDDPLVPLDNNLSERILRGDVLGRKNFMFNRSLQGAWLSSILFSVCATWDLNGVNSKIYMEETVTQIRNGHKFLFPHDYAQKGQNQIARQSVSPST